MQASLKIHEPIHYVSDIDLLMRKVTTVTFKGLPLMKVITITKAISISWRTASVIEFPNNQHACLEH